MGGGSRWCGTRVLSKTDRSSIVGPHPVVELQVSLLGRQSRRGLDETPGDAGAPCFWDDIKAEDLRRGGFLFVGSEADDSLWYRALFGKQPVRPGYPVTPELLVTISFVGQGRGKRAGRLFQSTQADVAVHRPLRLVQHTHGDLCHGPFCPDPSRLAGPSPC